MSLSGSGPGGWRRTTRKTQRLPPPVDILPPGYVNHASLNALTADGGKVTLGEHGRAHYLHVDDGIFLATWNSGSPACDRDMELVADAMEGHGFTVPDRKPATEEKRLVGYTLSQDGLTLELPPQKAANLTRALLWITESEFVDL